MARKQPRTEDRAETQEAGDPDASAPRGWPDFTGRDLIRRPGDTPAPEQVRGQAGQPGRFLLSSASADTKLYGPGGKVIHVDPKRDADEVATLKAVGWEFAPGHSGRR